MNLTQILSTRRAHNSAGDFLFRADLLHHLEPYQPTIEGGHGTIVVRQGVSRVAFSCHIDTCHNQGEPPTQKISIDNGVITLDDKASCLGADDGLGIYLMLRLLEGGVPGTYIFHTGEEVGAAASTELGQDIKFCATFDLIIAFDRAVQPGQAPEIIISQSGQRCASKECGQALADQLNLYAGLGYVISEQGVFTDTLNYRDLVAECFNVGVFYDLQHSPSEYVDAEKFFQLADAVLKVDWERLPIVRDPLTCVSNLCDGFNYGLNYSEGLVAALEDALDRDQGPLLKWLGNPHRGRLSNSTLENAYDDALSGTDDELVAQYLLENLE